VWRHSELVEECAAERIFMKTMYVYILECSDKSYYIGVTNNLERRFEEHEKDLNRNCYTYLRRPLKIVFYEMFNDPNLAITFEKKIKGWSRKKKEALIKKEFHLLPELSKSKSSPPSSTSSD
jgi:putative endonuclease